MKRGDIVVVAPPGDLGKPRPAIVIQSDALDESDTVLVCLITSTLRHAPYYRVPIEPSPLSGLRRPSHAMVEKLIALRRDKCGQVIGRLSDQEMMQLNRLLGLIIGIAD